MKQSSTAEAETFAAFLRPPFAKDAELTIYAGFKDIETGCVPDTGSRLEQSNRWTDRQCFLFVTAVFLNQPTRV